MYVQESVQTDPSMGREVLETLILPTLPTLLPSLSFRQLSGGCILTTLGGEGDESAGLQRLMMWHRDNPLT